MDKEIKDSLPRIIRMLLRGSRSCAEGSSTDKATLSFLLKGGITSKDLTVIALKDKPDH